LEIWPSSGRRSFVNASDSSPINLPAPASMRTEERAAPPSTDLDKLAYLTASDRRIIRLTRRTVSLGISVWRRICQVPDPDFAAVSLSSAVAHQKLAIRRKDGILNPERVTFQKL
jgi:hypothetical protein